MAGRETELAPLTCSPLHGCSTLNVAVTFSKNATRSKTALSEPRQERPVGRWRPNNVVRTVVGLSSERVPRQIGDVVTERG